MTAWDFVKSYLSPVMLFLRLCWLGIAVLAGFLAWTGSVNAPQFLVWGFSALFFWLALRPWRTTNMSQISKRIDEAGNKYR